MMAPNSLGNGLKAFGSMWNIRLCRKFLKGRSLIVCGKIILALIYKISDTTIANFIYQFRLSGNGETIIVKALLSVTLDMWNSLYRESIRWHRTINCPHRWCLCQPGCQSSIVHLWRYYH